MKANYNIYVTQRSLPINVQRGESVNLIFQIDLSYCPIAPDSCPLTHYRLKDDDKLYIGIMEPNQLFECAIFKKVLDKDTPVDEIGDPIYTLTMEDTEYLIPGTYYLMAKLLQTDGEDQIVTTVIPTTIFNIN